MKNSKKNIMNTLNKIVKKNSIYKYLKLNNIY